MMSTRPSEIARSGVEIIYAVSPATDGPPEGGRHAETDRKCGDRAEPDVHHRKSAVFVCEAAPEVRAPEPANHERGREIAGVVPFFVLQGRVMGGRDCDVSPPIDPTDGGRNAVAAAGCCNEWSE